MEEFVRRLSFFPLLFFSLPFLAHQHLFATLSAPENVQNIFSYAFTSVPVLPDPDQDPDGPRKDLYGGTGNAGYYGGVGGGPAGDPAADSTLRTSMGTLAGLGFG